MERRDILICKIQAMTLGYIDGGWIDANFVTEIQDVLEEYFDVIKDENSVDKRVVRSVCEIKDCFSRNINLMENEVFGANEELNMWLIHYMDQWMPKILTDAYEDMGSLYEDVEKALIDAGNPDIEKR